MNPSQAHRAGSVAARAMRENWDRRARLNPWHYVDTQFAGDRAAFFAVGEERTRLLIDPVLDAYGVDRGVALDLGCGLGRFTQQLCTRFREVVGVDVSPCMIEQAATLGREMRGDQCSLSFCASDGSSIPSEAAQVDFVWSYEVFQHMPARAVQQASLSAIGRVLRSNGIGLVHFRCAYSRAALLHRLALCVPTWFVRAAKRVVGKDPQTADAAWRGARPISRAEFANMCRRVGLISAEFRPDPTHATGSRLFAVVRKASSD